LRGYSGTESGRTRLRENHDFREAIQADLGRPVPRAKINYFDHAPNQHHAPRHPALARGALRDRHGRWARDAMDVAARETSVPMRTAKSCGLGAPTLALSFAGSDSREATVANKPGSPERARSKPLKPSRRECRTVSVDLWLLTRVFFILHTRLRVHRTPGIPCALCFRGAHTAHNSGTSSRENAGS
jgi:hypothetical protein